MHVRNPWSARWDNKTPQAVVNPYDGGNAYNDPFPFTTDIDGGRASLDPPVSTIDGGSA